MKIGKVARHYRGAVSPVIELGGLLYSNTTTVTNVADGDLMSATIPKEFLAKSGDSVEIEAVLYANSMSSNLDFQLDGTDQHVVASASGTYRILHHVTIIRATNLECVAHSKHLGASNVPLFWTYTWGGSDLVVTYRGANCSQNMLRAKLFPAG